MGIFPSCGSLPRGPQQPGCGQAAAASLEHHPVFRLGRGDSCTRAVVLCFSAALAGSCIRSWAAVASRPSAVQACRAVARSVRPAGFSLISSYHVSQLLGVCGEEAAASAHTELTQQGSLQLSLIDPGTRNNPRNPSAGRQLTAPWIPWSTT